MDAIFRVDGNDVVTSPYAAGPWDPSMQHGSPPAALVVWAAERIPTPVPMRVARVTVDLMRPVPVAPLTIESEVVREGRKIQLCAVRLLAKGVAVVSATVLKIKVQADELPPEAVIEQVTLPGPEQSRVEHVDFSIELVRDGDVAARRPWSFRPGGAGGDLVSRRSADRGGRAGFTGDADDGGGGFLQRDFVRAGFREWTFLNADLTVNFSREPQGDWILLDAESWIGPDGAGLAMARLADARGYFGRAVQGLVIEKR